MIRKLIFKRIVLSMLVFIITSVGYSQTKSRITKASKESESFSFIDAREIYLKVVDAGYSSPQVLGKLGDTYYKNGQYQDAVTWYSKLIDEYPNDVDVAYYYKASQSLKSLGKYSESNALMEIYTQKGGDSLIIRNYKKNLDYLDKIGSEAVDYTLGKVSINSDGSDFVSSFNNGKLIYASTYNSTGDRTYPWTNEGYLDLFSADIDENGNLSNSMALTGDVNSPYHESSTTFSKDGTTMYFTRNNYIDGKKETGKNKLLGLKIYKATKKEDNSWSNIVELPFNSDDYSHAYPSLSPDEKRLYFSSDRPGTFGMSDIWYVMINSDGTYGEPVNLGAEINTEAKEGFPFISSKNKLYFSSDGHIGLGGLDVFVTQLDENGNVGKIINIGEPTNSPLDDFGFIYNEDKNLGYISSNRDGGLGSVSDDIYLVRKCQVTISGTVTNMRTGELLANATLDLLDDNNMKLASVTSDENGRYTFINSLNCGTVFLVRAKTEGCEFLEKRVETPTDAQEFEVPMPLVCELCPPNDLGCRLCLQPIFFDFDRFNIRPDAEVELAKILVALQEYPQLKIHMESHTDSRGTFAYNEIFFQRN